MASSNLVGHTARPRVLCPENLSADGLTLLRKTLDVDEKQGLTPEQLIDMIPEYDALLVRSETKVTAALLNAARKLKVVARAGVGVDNVDVPAATRLGIVVVNSPSGNIQAAAEHTIALLMSLARNVPDADASLKAGKWERSRLVGVEVKGKTLGIVGLGKVGLIVARMARGLGMNVVAADPYASQSVAAAANVILVESLAELLPRADFLTIHTPMLASTRGMLSSTELNQMKRGARILNVARGGIVDEKALLSALDSGHIAGVAVDVFTSEPPTKDPDSAAARLVQHPKCIATPHLGASTVEAQENVSMDVCEQVLQILAGDLPRSAVNAPIILPAEYKTLQPFVRLVEKMGSLYTQHFTSPRQPAQRNINTFDLIYEGEITHMSSTKPLFAALIKGLTSPISDAEGFNVNIVNAETVAKERGIFVNEQKSRDPSTQAQAYSSLVTLVARAGAGAGAGSEGLVSTTGTGQQRESSSSTQHIISGYCSDNSPFISRLGRFSTSFVPEGKLLICHNYDSPGKIGVVGSVLGRQGVNINFMSVAPATFSGSGSGSGSGSASAASPTGINGSGSGIGSGGGGGDGAEPVSSKETTEALMILGVDKEVGDDVKTELVGARGVLNVSSVTL
ncbi:phosphoglycerate dehydrogenase [Capronia epimyces CBS 606.96]|uniref:D-3-phosphoglycerate dehydrogenase n=1 Tax=Capronia epimyces CBS 606.96 TaxID=1182542 RepID=W9XR05_9EURO|nr:phosphoglycerate dehydrogenase [Capronia epimyces CBS 606.96]EXJ82658.1 phosphoglycerate dehydrogenase [Capronia epimyces CBS 606.96]